MVSAPGLDVGARSLLGRAAEHIRGALDLAPEGGRYSGPVPPLLGRSDAVRDMDARLERGVLHAKLAVAALEQVDHPALRDAISGIASLGTRLEQRLQLPDAAARWTFRSRQAATDQERRVVATALDAVASDTSAQWIMSQRRASRTTADGLALQRAVAKLDPKLAHVEPWIPSEVPTSLYTSQYSSSVVEPLITDTGNLDDAVKQAYWRWQQQVGSQTFEMPAGDLRRIYEALRRAYRGAANPAPEWLMTPADEARVSVTPQRLATLGLLARGGGRSQVELLVAHSLVTDRRMSIFPGLDYGALMVRAARELPEELRPAVPPRAEVVPTVALEWARAIRERGPRDELAASTAPPAQQIHDILFNGGSVSDGVIGRTRVALDLVRKLEPTTEGGRQVRALLLGRLSRNAEQFERSWHAEYTDHGRAIALAETLAAVERTPSEDVGRIASGMAADAESIAAKADSIAW